MNISNYYIKLIECSLETLSNMITRSIFMDEENSR